MPEVPRTAPQETQTPVSGRILNPVSRGYAVGVGGVVGFLPMSQCLVRTAQRVGVLQPFMVSEVTRKMGMRGTLQPNLVVIDAEKLREVSHYDHLSAASADSCFKSRANLAAHAH